MSTNCLPTKAAAGFLIGLCACGASRPDSGGQQAEPDAATVAPARPDAAPWIDAGPTVVTMFVHTGEKLFTVDDDTFDLVEVGDFAAPDGGKMTDLAVTPDGSIYTISFAAVYQIDKASAAATPVVEIPGGNVGMTFLPDGTLLAADDDGGVRIIDPQSGAISEIGEFGNSYATAGDLVAVSDGTMFAIADEGPNGDENESNALLTVDTATGIGSAIGQIGYGGVFGCAVANNHVYAFTRSGDIIEIDPATGAGQLVRSYPEVPFWGAGVTPLAVID